MAENEDPNAQKKGEEKDDDKNKAATLDMNDPAVKAAIAAAVADALKPMKENLDKSYAERDAALQKVAEHEQKEREAEIKSLEEQGKHKEAYEARLAEERAAREALEKRNTELTRDVELKGALNAIDFRNKTASDMAYRSLVSDLVRNEQGKWVHKSGTSIEEAVTSYISNEDNAFLLKPKISSGSGTPPAKQGSPGAEPKSLFARPQAEVIKMAEEGKLPRQQI